MTHMSFSCTLASFFITYIQINISLRASLRITCNLIPNGSHITEQLTRVLAQLSRLKNIFVSLLDSSRAHFTEFTLWSNCLSLSFLFPVSRGSYIIACQVMMAICCRAGSRRGTRQFIDGMTLFFSRLFKSFREAKFAL